MIETIERMIGDLERGKLTRRQFAVSLVTLTAPECARSRRRQVSAL